MCVCMCMIQEEIMWEGKVVTGREEEGGQDGKVDREIKKLKWNRYV